MRHTIIYIAAGAVCVAIAVSVIMGVREVPVVNVPVGGSTTAPGSDIAGGDTVRLGGSTVRVTIADTPASREQGLSGRTGLDPDEGMLFVFPVDGEYAFWMKDMLFDIDVLWIDQNTIVGLQKDISHKRQEKEDFVSSKPADKVVELPAGFIDTHHVWVGQIVDFSDIYSSNDGF